MRTILILSLIAVILPTATALAAPPAVDNLRLCMNQRGVIVAKKKCSRRESRLSSDSLGGSEDGGGTGLNVYDATGRKIGPLVGLGQTITEIDGKKYSLRFGTDGLIGEQTVILHSEAGCAGTAYARSIDQLDTYSGLASAVVARPGRTLYLLKPGLKDPVSYASSSTMGNDCREGLLTSDPDAQRGYEVVVKGDADQLFPGPFDVRE